MRMSATFSKLGPLSLGESVSGFGPHIEELHAFFKTRTVAYGSAEDLKPFVDRLDSDAGFRDDIASMMRTIIYRQRDGLSWAELMELLAAAVGGQGVEEADAPEVRDAVRRLMAFVESVFRTRRNPGAAAVDGAKQGVALEPEHREDKEPEIPVVPVAQEAVTAEAAESAQAEQLKVDMFYRARIASEEEAAETLAEDRRAEGSEKRDTEADAIEPETVLHTELHWRVPFEDFEDRGTPERGSPVVAVGGGGLCSAAGLLRRVVCAPAADGAAAGSEYAVREAASGNGGGRERSFGDARRGREYGEACRGRDCGCEFGADGLRRW